MRNCAGCRCVIGTVFWTVLVDAETGKPLAYLDLDPY